MQRLQQTPAEAQTEKVIVAGRPFGTPIELAGWDWLPVTPLVTWLVMARLAGQRQPGRSRGQRLAVGALNTVALLGSEWCHNLAHAAAARLVGKPMDALRVVGGMPLVVYHHPHDPSITPRQHILRSLGGPLFNAALLGVAWLLRRCMPPGSAWREAADTAVGMNKFLCTLSLLPVPNFDGEPVLKWSLVAAGRSLPEAEQIVQQANAVTAPALGVATALALKKRRRVWASMFAMFGLFSAAAALGKLKEGNPLGGTNIGD
ncbi:MAG: hypothetical protein AB1894_03870 [Chloroflexota bacterium]